ncbi:prostaglandin D2 receptor 2 [Odontesthes bonariensis]|uniref:prostaglandin D2 receptor 2 n=1 Tax=Odontesthes bonariensis TaxID=219752 RepID=UPI003F5876F6
MAQSMNVSNKQLLCPLLEMMTNDAVNNNKSLNLMVVFIHGLVSFLGILENSLIIWVVGFRLRRHTVASVWVLNLAVSDFLATLTLPLFTVYLYWSHSWEIGDPLCKAQSSIFYLNMFVSAFLLAAISLDRLLLVVKPVWSQNHRSVTGAWKVCALGWLWAALNTIPYTVFRSVIEKKDGRKLCYHNFGLYLSSEVALERDCNVRQGATAISKMLLAFVFPLVVIAGSYIAIVLNLRKRHLRRKQSTDVRAEKNNPAPTKKINLHTTTSGQSHQRQLSQSFTRMVTSVIAAFALCWAPYHIFCMIELTAQYNKENLQWVEMGLPIAATLAFINPILNPILYAFSCPNFFVKIRQSLGAVFDGLLEERERSAMDPGMNLRAQTRRQSSLDVSHTTPGSLNGLHCQLPGIQSHSPSHLFSEGCKDSLMDDTAQESIQRVEQS